MSRYVDGFVLPVPSDRIEDYRALAEAASAIWKEHGCLEYWECVGDDLEQAHEGGPRSFPEMAGAKPDEAVMFS
ncbi:MAG: DUF1428 domain-containing protein [Phycisphaerales bacterium]